MLDQQYAEIICATTFVGTEKLAQFPVPFVGATDSVIVSALVPTPQSNAQTTGANAATRGKDSFMIPLKRETRNLQGISGPYSAMPSRPDATLPGAD